MLPQEADLIGDSMDAESRRPDFAILVYAVISSSKDYAHLNPRYNLLGEKHDKSLAL